MKRRYPGRRPLALVVVAALLATTACSKLPHRPKKIHSYSATVGAAGGQFQLGDVAVTVPAGAVKADTKLTVTEPSHPKVPALGMNSVEFDLALANGMQPAAGKPLQVAIPLKGSFVPAGARPAKDAVVFYTATYDNTGFRLIPSVVRDGVLYANVPHLSPKQLTYITVPSIEEVMRRDAAEISKKYCVPKQELEGIGTATVTSANNNGRVDTCLQLDGKDLALRIDNKSNYSWSVQAKGMTANFPTGSMDDEAARFIGATILPEPDVQGYLVRGTTVGFGLKTAQLPATVKLLTSNNGLLAEALWTVLKTAISLYMGKTDDEAGKLVKLLVNDFTDVEKCLQAATREAGDNYSSIADIVFSKCGEAIGAALISLGKEAATSAVDLGKYFKQVLAVGGALKDGLDNTVQAIEALVQTAKGGVSVTVDVTPNCPPPDEEIAKLFGRKLSPTFRVGFGFCDGKWMLAGANIFLPDINAWGDGFKAVFYWEAGNWRLYRMIGSASLVLGYDDVCNEFPPTFRKRVCVKPG